MISGAHKKGLPKALEASHHSILIRSHLSKWSLKSKKTIVCNDYSKVLDYIHKNYKDIDIILIMSNKSTEKMRQYICK